MPLNISRAGKFVLATALFSAVSYAFAAADPAQQLREAAGWIHKIGSIAIALMILGCGLVLMGIIILKVVNHQEGQNLITSLIKPVVIAAIVVLLTTMIGSFIGVSIDDAFSQLREVVSSK